MCNGVTECSDGSDEAQCQDGKSWTKLMQRGPISYNCISSFCKSDQTSSVPLTFNFVLNKRYFLCYHSVGIKRYLKLRINYLVIVFRSASIFRSRWLFLGNLVSWFLAQIIHIYFAVFLSNELKTELTSGLIAR